MAWDDGSVEHRNDLQDHVHNLHADRELGAISRGSSREPRPARLSAAILMVLLSACERGSLATAGPSSALPRPCDSAGSVVHASAPFGPLGHRGTVIYLPPCYREDRSRRYPTIYLLHGGSADETQWSDIGIPASADRLITSGIIPSVIIVMPDGGPTMRDSLAGELVDRLVPWTDRTYRTRDDASDRAVGGISLGGRVALEAVAARPGLFAAVGGHSPALKGDYAHLAARLGVARVAVRLDVGESESLRTWVQRFATAVRAAGAGVEVATAPGHHDRAYWRSQVPRYLRFYAERWRPRSQR